MGCGQKAFVFSDAAGGFFFLQIKKKNICLKLLPSEDCKFYSVML